MRRSQRGLGLAVGDMEAEEDTVVEVKVEEDTEAADMEEEVEAMVVEEDLTEEIVEEEEAMEVAEDHTEEEEEAMEVEGDHTEEIVVEDTAVEAVRIPMEVEEGHMAVEAEEAMEVAGDAMIPMVEAKEVVEDTAEAEAEAVAVEEDMTTMAVGMEPKEAGAAAITMVVIEGVIMLIAEKVKMMTMLIVGTGTPRKKKYLVVSYIF